MSTTLNTAEAKINEAVKNINEAYKANGAASPASELTEVQPFVQLSIKLADSLVEVYSAILNEVENKLEDAKLDAKRIREIAEKRAADVADLRKRLEGFSTTMLDAHQSYFQPEESKDA